LRLMVFSVIDWVNLKSGGLYKNLIPQAK